MKGNRECPPRPQGEISFTTGKPKPPEPPPMRKVAEPSSGFGFYLMMCVGCIAFGIMCGLKMAS